MNFDIFYAAQGGGKEVNMKKLRISSTTNLSFRKENESFADYIKKEIAFQRKMGFDATDLNLSSPDVGLGDWEAWEATVESIVRAAQKTNTKFELCHLPFVGEARRSAVNITMSFARE